MKRIVSFNSTGETLRTYDLGFQISQNPAHCTFKFPYLMGDLRNKSYLDQIGKSAAEFVGVLIGNERSPLGITQVSLEPFSVVVIIGGAFDFDEPRPDLPGNGNMSLHGLIMQALGDAAASSFGNIHEGFAEFEQVINRDAEQDGGTTP